jgi:hypothetical protein
MTIKSTRRFRTELSRIQGGVIPAQGQDGSGHAVQYVVQEMVVQNKLVQYHVQGRVVLGSMVHQAVLDKVVQDSR